MSRPVYDGLGPEVRQGSPAALRALAPGTRDAVVSAVAHAVHDGFLAMLPFGVLSVIVLSLMRNVTLSDEVHEGFQSALPALNLEPAVVAPFDMGGSTA